MPREAPVTRAVLPAELVMTGDAAAARARHAARVDEMCARAREGGGRGAGDENDGLTHNRYLAGKTTHDKGKRPAIIRVTKPDRDFASGNLNSDGVIEKDFVSMAAYLPSMVGRWGQTSSPCGETELASPTSSGAKLTRLAQRIG